MEQGGGRSGKKNKRYGVSYILFFLAMLGFIICGALAAYFGSDNYAKRQQLEQMYDNSTATSQHLLYASTTDAETLTLSETLTIMQDQYSTHQSHLSMLLTVVGLGFAVFSVAMPIFNYAFFQKEQVNILHARIAELEENIEANAAKIREETYDKLERMQKQIVQSGEIITAQVGPPDAPIEITPISDNNNDKAFAHFVKAALLFARKRYNESLQYIRMAVNLDPSNETYQSSFGITLHEMKRFDEALVEKQRTVDLNPNNAEYHDSLGLTLHAMKRYEEALRAIQRAIELDKDNAVYRFGLGLTLHVMERYGEALRAKQRAIDLDNENAMYYDSLSNTLYAMERYEDALVATKRAIELEPNNAIYFNSLAITLDAIERYEDALKAIQRAIELEPNNAEYHYGFGLILHSLTRPDEAKIEFLKAIELDPNNPGYHAKAKELGYIDDPEE